MYRQPSNVFANKSIGEMISLGRNLSLKCHANNSGQIAHEPYDLNMDFRSFDNGVKQLCTQVFIELRDMLI